MRAMVLAAGLGTRLRPLTLERPKPAVPVANRPLAWFAIDHLARAGATRVVLNTHHLAGVLRAELEGSAPRGVELVLLHEETLLGTGGAMANAREALIGDGAGDEPVVVMNGDILFAPDLAAAIATHVRLGAVATMVLRSDPDAARYGAIEIDAEGRVRRLLGTPEDAGGPLSTYMFTGVHVLSARAFDDMPREGCVVRHAYRKWVDEGAIVAGHVDESPWLDLGTPAAYLEANLAIARGALRWPGIVPGDGASVVAGSASIGAGAIVSEAVIGEGARIAPGVRVSRSVVWSGASVDRDAIGAIVSTSHVVVP